MNLCYLSLGSNLDSPERQLRLAINALQKLPKSYVIKTARLYRTQAFGRKTQPHYVNSVVALNTLLTPYQLLHYCQKIEKQQGRVRKIRWGARSLDIDLLLYNNKKMDSPTLTLPHPRMHERDFVMIPLIEIACTLLRNRKITYPGFDSPHSTMLRSIR